mmetsp:Transcript_7602/g.20771  ORF Transcript_7602/g.20771 Transcript_7602/m.20771 type:complete len:402 (-) Transcript_7602:561-1766(-)
MPRLTSCIALAGLAAARGAVFLKEDFSGDWEKRWVVSDWKKDEGTAGTWSVTAGEFYGDAEADKGLKTMEDARFYAISTAFDEFSNADKPLVVQFSVKHEQDIDCGGGYIKLFPKGVDQQKLHGGEDEDKYNIMFGPDICGYTKRTHFILNHKDKNHLISKDMTCKSDTLTHVYTLILKPDRTFEVLVDGESERSGNIIDEFDILPPKEIKDPAVSKPEDWVDEKMIDDPEDVKPEGYDDIPKEIADPEATKPEDWDDEDDGEWEPPMISNPEYKGPWKAKRIENPEYKGEWEHPMIANPEFVDDEQIGKYSSFAVAAFEVWQVKSGTIFDNLILTDDPAEAEKLRKETWEANKDKEKEMYDKIQEDKRKAEEEAAAAAGDDDEEAEDDEEVEEEELKDEV